MIRIGLAADEAALRRRDVRNRKAADREGPAAYASAGSDLIRRGESAPAVRLDYERVADAPS